MTTVTVSEETITLTQEVVETITVTTAEQGPPGVSGVDDHGDLNGLADDDHTQYHTDARGDARYSLLAHNHAGTYEPADAAIQSHIASTANPHSVTSAQVGADASGTAAGLIATHEAGTGVHSIAAVTGLQTALDGKAATSHDHAATYAPIGAGVTNGDSHDHSGGDGAQIAYSGLSGLPTLGTAAATASTDYATAAQGSLADSAMQPGDDAADLGSGAATDGYVLTADGIGGAAWEAAAVTYAGAASEIHAATTKTTPVDADELGLVDSAASWVLKKLSWANLKTTLSSVFAVLAGKSGGQTLIGGTGVTDKLALQGTTGNGTVTSTALEVKVGNNGALSALNLLNSGQLIIQGDATTDLPVYDSELLTSAGWTVNAGWTESPDDTFTHTGGGGTGTLTHSATITSSHKYQISWTVTGRTAGSFTVAVGGQSVANQTATSSFGPTATTNTAFTITPTTDFNGTLSLVSLKRITAVSTPIFIAKDSAGTVNTEIRVGSAAGNVFFGENAGANNTDGSQNSAFGKDALLNNTTGSNNCAQGNRTLFNNTTGSNNCAQGQDALLNNTTGSNNCAQGVSALRFNTTGSYNCTINGLLFNTAGNQNTAIGINSSYNNTTGSYNCALGSNAHFSNTTGSYNCAIGYIAGRYHANGTTALTDPEYSVYIGTNARGKDNADNNSVVIGGNTPIGLGANTTVIGTSATTLTRLYGDLGLGVDAPSAKIHALKTTEQLRLGYDATNYASHTVNANGDLAIDPVGKLDITGATAYTLGKTVDFEVGAGNIGWRDLIADIQIRNNPSTDPTWAQIGTSPFWAYRFDVGEKVWITFHINHDYYPGGQILLHTHWISSGTDTTNSVKWQFTYSVMKGHNQTGGDLSTTGTVVTAENVSGGQYRHMISEISSSITVTNAEVDSLICVVIERITNGATDNSDNIFLLTADCHYQASRFATPNRSPNFYS